MSQLNSATSSTFSVKQNDTKDSGLPFTGTENKYSLGFLLHVRGGKKKMHTHAHTIRVWLESVVVLCAPVCCWEGKVGEGDVCRERLKLNDFFLCSGKRGWQKEG